MKLLPRWLAKKTSGILSLTSTHVINIVVAVLTLPIILSSLPIAGYGKWQFILAIQAWVLVFSAPQITDATKRGLALGQDGTFFYALFKRGKILLCTSLIFILLSIYFALTDRLTFSLLSGVSVAYIFFNLLTQTSIGEYFTAKKEFLWLGAWSILSSPIARIGSCLIAFFTNSIVSFVLFQICFATLISLIAIILLILKRGLWRQYVLKNYDASCVKFGLRSIPTDLLGITSNRIIEILIGVFFGLSSLAYFSVARDLRNEISNIQKISMPLYYAEFVKQPFEILVQKIHKHIFKMISISTVLGAVGVIFGVFYIKLLLPSEFHVAIPLLMILSLALPIGIPTVIFATALNTHFRYRATAFATAIPNMIEIIFVALFGWIWGIIGMVTAVAVYGYISFVFFYLATVQRECVKKILEKNRGMRAIMNLY
jgi:O-antigen/teichoic acid export membrane protein